ncbi:MAG: hypothetical protein IJ690_02320 [Clostridia bacterium]|nr:hypothetical protein [Clostridia bacterium]
MARYVIRKCLFCNRTIEFEHKERSEYSNYIGLPWQRCPYCKQIYATGLKFYIDMTEEEKQKLKDCRIGNFISNMFMNLILITVVVAIATVFLRNLEISFFNTINNEIAVPIAVILVSLFSIFLAIIGTEMISKRL